MSRTAVVTCALPYANGALHLGHLVGYIQGDIWTRATRMSGATVHFVSDEVDAGPIIAQAAVPVHADDDEASLAARVLQQEHRLLPQAVRHVLEGRVRFSERRAVLVGIEHGELSLLAS